MATPTTRHIPSTFMCVIIIAAIKLALRSFGLGRTLRMVKRIRPHCGPVVLSHKPTVDAITRRVATVSAYWPTRALCLEQSLTLYLLLGLSHIPAALCFGVRPYGFVAHAWVEWNGEPIEEKSDYIRQFLPMKLA